MALKGDLELKVKEFARSQWGDIPNGYVVPSAESLTLGNSGTRIDACVLYADLHRSTEMVDSLADVLAAEYYKAFLHCAAKIIKDNDGEVTAYDGDRVMAIFVGDDQANRAVLTAFQINCAVRIIINPVFAATYPQSHRPLQHTVGIDCGRLLVAKTGVRVDNDLVWVGPAANYAAKLNSFQDLDIAYQTRVTQQVLDALNPGFHRENNQNPVWFGPYDNLKKRIHYRSDVWVDIG